MATRIKLLGLLVGSAMVLGASGACATTYALSETIGSLTLGGTITTNGRFGPLAVGDIQTWDLTLTGFGPPVSMVPLFTFYFILGDNLVATPTDLQFNFAAQSPGLFFIMPARGNCAPCGFFTLGSAGQVSENFGLMELAVEQSNVSFGQEREITTNEIIGRATPLPGTFSLFTTALAALGLLGCRRKRKAQAAAQSK